MSWTKRDFIVQAFNQLGLGTYEFDQQPAQYQMALQILDSMMATWDSEGVRVGYPLPSNANDSVLSQPTNVPSSANEAIYTNLAIRVAPGYGKTISPDVKMAAKQSYSALMAMFQQNPPMQYPQTMPGGMGNKWWRYAYNPFLIRPVSPIQAGTDSYIQGNVIPYQGPQQ